MESTTWNLILEYVKALAWPTITIIFLSFYFRNEVKGLINRINSVKLPGDILVNTSTDQPTPNDKIPDDIRKSEKIKEEVEKESQSLSPSKKDIEDQINSLIKDKTLLSIALTFERTYRLIFGSQIKLLERLRTAGSGGILYQDISAYYQGVRLRFPHLNSYSLDNYLNFLANSRLLDVQISAIDERRCKITPLGIDFLEYIEALNYSKEKPN